MNMLMEREGVEGADTAPQPIPVPVDTAQLDALKQQLAEKECRCSAIFVHCKIKEISRVHCRVMNIYIIYFIEKTLNLRPHFHIFKI